MLLSHQTLPRLRWEHFVQRPWSPAQRRWQNLPRSWCRCSDSTAWCSPWGAGQKEREITLTGPVALDHYTTTWMETHHLPPCCFTIDCVWMTESFPKVKSTCFDCHLVTGGSIEYESFLHVNGWDINPTKKSKYMFNTFLSKMVSVIVGSSYHTDVCHNYIFVIWCFKHVYSSPNHYCTDSGTKWRHQEYFGFIFWLWEEVGTGRPSWYLIHGFYLCSDILCVYRDMYLYWWLSLSSNHPSTRSHNLTCSSCCCRNCNFPEQWDNPSRWHRRRRFVFLHRPIPGVKVTKTHYIHWYVCEYTGTCFCEVLAHYDHQQQLHDARYRFFKCLNSMMKLFSSSSVSLGCVLATYEFHTLQIIHWPLTVCF